MEQEGKRREEGPTSILSLWQIPDSQRRSSISISSAREMWGGEEGKKALFFQQKKEKGTEHSGGEDSAVAELDKLFSILTTSS